MGPRVSAQTSLDVGGHPWRTALQQILEYGRLIRDSSLGYPFGPRVRAHPGEL